VLGVAALDELGLQVDPVMGELKAMELPLLRHYSRSVDGDHHGEE